MSNQHERFARQTIELARQARAAGNHPFGALLVLDGEVVASAQNTVFTDRDPTAHAETNLVSHAIRELSPEVIRRSVLYRSLPSTITWNTTLPREPTSSSMPTFALKAVHRPLRANRISE